jgi:hypothetical protein
MVEGVVNLDRAALLIADPDDAADLEFDVEPLRRDEAWPSVVASRDLAVRPGDRRAGGDDRACSAVVRDGEGPPVREDGGALGPEDLAHVAGVVHAAVAVDEVTDRHRQEHLQCVLADEGARRQRLGGAQHLLQRVTDGLPHLGAFAQERVEGVRGEGGRTDIRGEQTVAVQHGQVDGVSVEGHDHSRLGIVVCAGHAERKVGQPEAGPDLGSQRLPLRA